MMLDDFLSVACIVLTIVSYAVYKWTSTNVYLKYKEQRVVIK